MRSPILFIVFNRLDTAARVFEEIRKACPPRLYIAADGPREGRAGEAAKVAEVRAFLDGAVDWPCEVRTLYRTENLGCRSAVSSAISWFFENEEEGIVLEDDCLPSPSFFPYCDAMLERYRDRPEVMCVSGDNFLPPELALPSDYHYTRYIHIWGWASWRRAWNGYDADIKEDWGAHGEALLRGLFPRSAKAREHWARSFGSVADGKIDTWDYQWNYHIWRRGGLAVAPGKNLISNIGFGPEATHTTEERHPLAELPVFELGDPLRGPDRLRPFKAGDEWESVHMNGTPPDPTAWRRWTRVPRRMARNLLQDLGILRKP